MFGKKIHLFTAFGLDVGIDWTWFLFAALIVLSLAGGLFPSWFKGYSSVTYWLMGICGAFGLFFSIVSHEFWHSIVARWRGLNMRGITLFIFGGVAEMEDEPKDAKTEFLIAIAGPISSVALGSVFLLFYWPISANGWSGPIAGVFEYLGAVNFVLAVFNMVPAFPLDGGRVLRSIL
jgi:Zn-dependent protease